MSVSAMTYTGVACSEDRELLAEFMQSVHGSSASATRLTLHGVADVFLEALAPEAVEQGSHTQTFQDSDFTILLVRHLHAAAIARIVSFVQRIPHHAANNLHVTICRKTKEHEYKISCTKCSQNLIVNDVHAFTRVRCPHCKDVFIVPGQTDLIRGVLLLNASQTVRKVVIDNTDSCREAVAQMITQTRHPTETMKRSTMRIELPQLLFDDQSPS